MKSSMVHRLCWGLVIVAIGVVFLLNQIGLTTMNIGELFSQFWPVFIILPGLQGLLLQGGRVVWWNFIVIFIGVYFLGRNLGWFVWAFSDMIRLIGPIAIILFGVCMIFQGNRGKSPCKQNDLQQGEQWNPITPPITRVPPAPPMPPGPPPAPPEWDEFDRQNSDFQAQPSYEPAVTAKPSMSEETARQSSNAQYGGWKQKYEHKEWWKAHDWNSPNRENHSRFIGDVHLGNEYWELRPMNISHFIGDTTLDLTKAQIPVGETRINVSSFIGDVKVYVPNDLGVGIQIISSCLIGDVKVLDQKRGGVFNQISVETPSYADTDKRVVLVVSSFIGDVRVTKVG
jgi:lia operon protein LiaF